MEEKIREARDGGERGSGSRLRERERKHKNVMVAQWEGWRRRRKEDRGEWRKKRERRTV